MDQRENKASAHQPYRQPGHSIFWHPQHKGLQYHSKYVRPVDIQRQQLYILNTDGQFSLFIYRVKVLDGVRPSMPNNTKNAIYNNILKSIKGMRKSGKSNTLASKWSKTTFLKQLMESFFIHYIKNSVFFAGQRPPRCYRNNSFIAFINESLLGFGPPPNVTTLLSLVPQSQKIEARFINSSIVFSM